MAGVAAGAARYLRTLQKSWYGTTADSGSRRSGNRDPSRSRGRNHLLASSTILGLSAVVAVGANTPAGATGSSAAGRSAASSLAAAATSHPNIVIFLTDDQPTRMLGVMGNVRSTLQRRGVTFTHAFASTPLCAPSRATLLTGRDERDTVIYDNRAPSGGWHRFHALGLESQTLATRLDAVGYRTALVGKYLNGFGQLSPPSYVPPGWDFFAGLVPRQDGTSTGNCGGAGACYYNYGVRVKDHDGVRVVNHGSSAADYSTNVLRSHALDFVLTTPQTTPLFLVFAPSAPHTPTLPHPDYAGTVPRVRPSSPDINERNVSDKSTWLRRSPVLPWSAITPALARQRETLRSVDDAVARIVGAVGSRARKTLFVFMSDNGYLNGSHRLQGKVLAYRRSSQVPLIMRWDGHLPANAKDSRMVSMVDVTASVLDAAGLRTPPDGYSLLGQPIRRGLLISATDIRSPAYCAWRTHRWLYIKYSDDHGQELYDYRADPFELSNVASLPRYHHRLADMRERTRAACAPAPPGFIW